MPIDLSDNHIQLIALAIAILVVYIVVKLFMNKQKKEWKCGKSVEYNNENIKYSKINGTNYGNQNKLYEKLLNESSSLTDSYADANKLNDSNSGNITGNIDDIMSGINTIDSMNHIETMDNHKHVHGNCRCAREPEIMPYLQKVSFGGGPAKPEKTLDYGRGFPFSGSFNPAAYYQSDESAFNVDGIPYETMMKDQWDNLDKTGMDPYAMLKS